MSSKQTPPNPASSPSESLDPPDRQSDETILTDPDVWGHHFVLAFQDAYLLAASSLAQDAGVTGLRRAALSGFVTALAESSATQEEIAELLKNAFDGDLSNKSKLEWTAELNARRVELIDKKIQQTLSPDDAMELARLTSHMRAHFDTEEMVPLEGARRLHTQLTDVDDLKRTPS